MKPLRITQRTNRPGTTDADFVQARLQPGGRASLCAVRHSGHADVLWGATGAAVLTHVPRDSPHRRACNPMRLQIPALLSEPGPAPGVEGGGTTAYSG